APPPWVLRRSACVPDRGLNPRAGGSDVCGVVEAHRTGRGGRGRSWLAVGAAFLAWVAPARAADQVTVPPAVQADLLARVAGYDSALVESAAEGWRILIVVKGGDAESQRAGTQFAGGL